MEEILKDALFLANVCDTLQISGYIKQELFDEHAALAENINETIARVFNYAAQHSVQQALVGCGAKIVNQIEPNLPAVCSKCGGTCG